MKNNILIKILGMIVILAGITVMAGWIFDIEILKSILPMWVTMKFTTALSFFLSGILLVSIAQSLEKRTGFAQVFLAVTTLCILLLMLMLLMSVILGVRTGIEDIFVKETEGAVKTTTPGRPSLGTMVNFILIAAGGIMTLVDVGKLKEKLRIIGIVITLIGSVAIAGYVLNQPILYYSIENVSTAMAVHTAILFVLIGMGKIFLTENK